MAARLSSIVYLMMGLFYPITAPIAWVLDRWLGGHHTFKRYTREEVRTMFNTYMCAGRSSAPPPKSTPHHPTPNLTT